MEQEVSKVSSAASALSAHLPGGFRRLASIAAILSSFAAFSSCTPGVSENAARDDSPIERLDGYSLAPSQQLTYSERCAGLRASRLKEMQQLATQCYKDLDNGMPRGLAAAKNISPGNRADFISYAGAQLEREQPANKTQTLRMEQCRVLLDSLGEHIPAALAARCDHFVSAELERIAASELRDPINELDVGLRYVHRIRGICGDDTKAECDRVIETLNHKLSMLPRSAVTAAVQSEILHQEAQDDRRLMEDRGRLDNLAFFDLSAPMAAKMFKFYLQHSSQWRDTPDGWCCKESTGTNRWLLSTEISSDIDDSFIILRRADNPVIAVRLPFQGAAAIIMADHEDDLFQQAYSAYYREQDASSIHSLEEMDLQNVPVLYQPVFPKRYNQVISSNLSTAMLCGYTLQARYGADHVSLAPIVFTDNPAEQIESALRTSLAAHPAKCVVLDLYAHGSPSGAYYDKFLTAKDLCAMARAFPEQNFVVKTIACYGGGFREGLEHEFASAPELRSRITLIAETKPIIVNEISVVQERGSDPLEVNNLRGSRFQYYLIRSLLADPHKNLGDAIREADRQTKLHSGYDPEVLRNGTLISVRNFEDPPGAGTVA